MKSVMKVKYKTSYALRMEGNRRGRLATERLHAKGLIAVVVKVPADQREDIKKVAQSMRIAANILLPMDF